MKQLLVEQEVRKIQDDGVRARNEFNKWLEKRQMQTTTKPCGMAKVRENMKQKLDAVDPFKLRHVPCSIFIFILSLEFLVCFVNLYRHHVILCKQDKLKGSDGLACYV